ncbi:hypothetical protein FEM48_Zijuj04G0153200 [Ziziphus jujuba var. spinosa]|uniref:WAT1-related protein n=1 Tax=Ziziphus jujuba var. spinosa TaxID=714518 RepID=A0A978VKM2_ZIZJJ|nr:hypothetical protein FEM48_Zijuj04G0153200 [Ziziphus jujuba var. spinosa]
MHTKTNMEEEEAGGVLRGRSRREVASEECIPYLFCIFSAVCFAGFNIISKVYLDKGMSVYVLVAYGHAFGTLTTAFLAFLFERNNQSKISTPIFRNIFFLGLLGAVLGRTLFYKGLEYTSPIFTSALAITLPSITFIFAVLFRMEKLEISKLGGQAKVGGTAIALAGATTITLYKVIAVISSRTKDSHQTSSSIGSIDKDWIKGSLMLIVSYISLSLFFILQTKTIKMYPAPMTLTALTCLSATLLSTIMTAILDHKAASWRLSWNITLLAPLYSGIVVFGIIAYVQTLILRRKGPVFTIAFRPLSTVMVAIMGVLILREALRLGRYIDISCTNSIIGALLIVIGLYATLWGKKKEKEKDTVEHTSVSQQLDTEIKLDK